MFTLTEPQRQFVFDPAPYLGFYGGIGNGKSLAAILRALMLCDKFPGNYGLVGRLYSTELKRTTEKDFLDVVKARNGGTLDEGPYVQSYKQNPSTLVIKTYVDGKRAEDSTIYFQYLESLQPILSMNLGWWYVDQAEFIPEETYLALEGRLRYWTKPRQKEFKAKYPSLTRPGHLGFITGNPAPGWVHNRYKKNITGQYKLIEAPTDSNAANLPKNYISQLRANNSEEWVARYLEGSWETWAGQIYKDYQRKLHTVPIMKIPDHWPRFLGWDHGTTNPTAVSFVAIDEEGNCIVYNEYYQSGLVIRDHAKNVLALAEGDAVPRTANGGIVVWMDPSIKGEHDAEGRDFRQLYNDFKIHGVAANNRVKAGIQKVQLLIKPDSQHRFPRWHPNAGKLGSPRLFFMETRCPATQREIELYHWKPVKEGTIRNPYEEPEKYMDHAMDALRYAVMAIFEHAKPLQKENKLSPFDEYVAKKMGVIQSGIPDEFWQ